MPVPQVQQTSFRPTTVFELDALEGLQCGCVTVSYRTRPWGFIVVALEAKGPYCTLGGHTVGQILHLGEPFDQGSEEEEDRIR
jgi:hypothetical protein